jgi:parvulin-like peptidyl-prolyl isomerase
VPGLHNGGVPYDAFEAPGISIFHQLGDDVLMRRAIFIFVLGIAAAGGPQAFGASAPPQSARVVARIEGDIILQSQVRELGAFQQLIDGHAESDDKLLEELIEQWVVETEATASHFPQPAQSEVDRELTRLKEHFASPESYASRLKELGLSASEVRQLLTRQIYVERYVDYKFRPSVQIEPADINAYYKKQLVPELAKKNQPAPDPAAVEEQIRELLIQRGISDLTAKWLDDTKSRLKIEIETAGGKP